MAVFLSWRRQINDPLNMILRYHGADSESWGKSYLTDDLFVKTNDTLIAHHSFCIMTCTKSSMRYHINLIKALTNNIAYLSICRSISRTPEQTSKLLFNFP